MVCCESDNAPNLPPKSEESGRSQLMREKVNIPQKSKKKNAMVTQASAGRPDWVSHNVRIPAGYGHVVFGGPAAAKGNMRNRMRLLSLALAAALLTWINLHTGGYNSDGTPLNPNPPPFFLVLGAPSVCFPS